MGGWKGGGVWEGERKGERKGGRKGAGGRRSLGGGADKQRVGESSPDGLLENNRVWSEEEEEGRK